MLNTDSFISKIWPALSRLSWCRSTRLCAAMASVDRLHQLGPLCAPHDVTARPRHARVSKLRWRPAPPAPGAAAAGLGSAAPQLAAAVGHGLQGVALLSFGLASESRRVSRALVELCVGASGP